MVITITNTHQQKDKNRNRQGYQRINIVKKNDTQIDPQKVEHCVLMYGLNEKISKKDVATIILKDFKIKGVSHIATGVFLVFTNEYEETIKIQKELDQAKINGTQIRVISMMKNLIE